MKRAIFRSSVRHSAVVPGTAGGWLRFGVNTHPKHAPPVSPGR